MEIKNCFYRVSIKALILNDARDKFLVCKEDNDLWELPGGGLDWGATPQEDLPREIKEEMGIDVVSVAEHPSYFLTTQSPTHDIWVVNILYETVLPHLEFIPSDECIEIKFIDKNDTAGMNLFSNIPLLLDMFDPQLHSK